MSCATPELIRADLPVGALKPQFEEGTIMDTRVPDSVVEAFAALDPAFLSDVLRGLGLKCHTVGLQPLDSSTRVCGRAVTMRNIPSRDPRSWSTDQVSLMALAAHAEPGDILVVDAAGEPDVTPVGSNTIRHLKNAGIGGVVIDGAVRDTAEIVEVGLPVLAKSKTVASSQGYFYSTCVNTEPVRVGAIMVAPGDIVLADGDGLVAIPKDRADEVLKLAGVRKQSEAEIQGALASGLTMNSPEVLSIVERMQGATAGVQ